MPCRTRDCPKPDSADFHKCALPDFGVRCWGPLGHQHRPKRSQGGKSIVCVLCAIHHDITDNTKQSAGLRFSDELLEEGWEVRYVGKDDWGRALVRLP